MPLVPSLLIMEKDFRGTIKSIGGRSTKKEPSDYYFWVVDEVKISQSLYSNQQILDYFLREFEVTRPEQEHFVDCLPCKPSGRACHIAKVFDDKELTFFFVCDVLFSSLGIRLPFTPFEVECLDFINIALTQLHPNS